MKRCMAAFLCGCLLIGSFYPKLLMDHHVKLVDSCGVEKTVEGSYQEQLPVKLESGLWKFIRSLK